VHELVVCHREYTVLREVRTLRGNYEKLVCFIEIHNTLFRHRFTSGEQDIFEFRLAFGQCIDRLCLFQEQSVIAWTWRVCFSSLEVSSVYESSNI
jgi:hypothetical protein